MNDKGEVAGGSMYRVEVIAKLFGVTVRRIQQLTQEGVLPTTETPEGRRYDLVPTIQKYVKYLSDKAYGKNRSEKISIHALRGEGDSKNGEKHLRFCFIIKRSAQIWKSLSKNIRKNSCNLHRTA